MRERGRGGGQGRVSVGECVSDCLCVECAFYCMNCLELLSCVRMRAFFFLSFCVVCAHIEKMPANPATGI